MHLASIRSAQHAVALLHGLRASPVRMHCLQRRVRQAGFYTHNASFLGCGFGTRSDRLSAGRWRKWLTLVSPQLELLRADHECVSVVGLCIGAALALCDGFVPPTDGLHRSDPQCDFDCVRKWARLHLRLEPVVSNSFALGGSRAVLIASRPGT